jgi:hypothetical protein
MLPVLKLIWAGWKTVAHKIGNFQSRALLFVFYYLVLGPFSLAMRVFSDPLRLRSAAPHGWMTRSTPDSDALAAARRQF